METLYYPLWTGENNRGEKISIIAKTSNGILGINERGATFHYSMDGTYFCDESYMSPLSLKNFSLDYLKRPNPGPDMKDELMQVCYKTALSFIFKGKPLQAKGALECASRLKSAELKTAEPIVTEGKSTVGPSMFPQGVFGTVGHVVPPQATSRRHTQWVGGGAGGNSGTIAVTYDNSYVTYDDSYNAGGAADSRASVAVSTLREPESIYNTAVFSVERLSQRRFLIDDNGQCITIEEIPIP